MTKPEDRPPSDIILVTVEDLCEEQKDQFEKYVQEYQDKCLKTFSKTRNGVTQKSPYPIADDPHVISQNEKRMFQEAIDSALHHTLIN